jgi:hypothetical protein
MKQLGILIFAISCLFQGWTQKTINTVVSSSTVAAFEQFRFEIIINSAECQVTSPKFGGFEVVNGPSSSQSNRVNIVNNVRTQVSEYKWTYTLRAKKEGTYTIPGVKMTCGSETFESEPIEVVVSKNKAAADPDKDFFMRLTSNKSKVYEGEPFIATLKYYAKVKPESFETLELGDAVGIFRQDIDPDRTTYQTTMERINGVAYYTVVLREEICYAQRTGQVSLEPYYASLVFQQDFFNRYRKETFSNTLTVDVEKIPGVDADKFSGLVGNFEMTSTLSKSTVKTGDAIDLKISISGKGNFQNLGELEIKIPDEFETFDPTIDDNTKVTSTGITGTIDYNFVLIPKHRGEYKIPKYTLNYFDIENKQIRSISTEDFVISVEKREGLEVDKQPIDTVQTDILYIDETNDGLFEKDDFVFGTMGYYGALISPLLLSIFLIVLKRKKENLSEDDLLKIQQKKNIKIAQAALKDVRQLASNGEDTKALKLLQTILNTFFKAKFNMGLSDLSQKNIAARLENISVSEDSIQHFNKIWNTIEMGQYAPIAHENLVQTVNKTEELLLDLDKKI